MFIEESQAENKICLEKVEELKEFELNIRKDDIKLEFELK